MHKELICFADKDKVLHPSFVAAALKKYPSAMGIALVDPADGTLSAQGAPNPTAEAVIKTSTTFTKPGVLFSFGDHPPGALEEDIQPFIILADEQNNALMYAFITGSYPGSMRRDSAHSDAYHFANDFLKQKFEQLYDILDKDLSKLVALCDKPIMRNDLMNGAVGPSCVTLIFSDSSIKTYVKDLEPVEFAFGWTTDDCGYRENVGDYPPKEEGGIKKLPAALARKAKSLIAGSSVPTPETPVAVPKPIEATNPQTRKTEEPIKPVVPKMDTAPITIPKDLKLPSGVTLGTDGNLYWTPPAELHHKQLKKGFQRVAGFLPNNPKGHWQSRPTVPLTAAKVADMCRSLPHLKTAMEAKARSVKDNAGTSKPVQATKAADNVKPAVEQKSSTGTVPTVTEKIVPITSENIDPVTEKVLENFMPTAKRFIDPFSNEIFDPRALQEQEEKMSIYAKSLGITGVEATVRWPPEALKLLGQKSIDALVDLALDYRLMWLRTLTKVELDNLSPSVTEKKLPAALARKKAKGSAVM